MCRPFEPDAGNPAVGKLYGLLNISISARPMWRAFFLGEQFMIITINGKQTQVRAETTITELLESKGINVDTVVIEYNRDIIPKENFAETKLNDGDFLEVLRFVGGG